MIIEKSRLAILLEIGLLFPFHYKALDEEFKRRDCTMHDYAVLCLNIEAAFNNISIEKLKHEDNYGYIGEFMRNEYEIVHNIFADFIKSKPF